MGLLADWISTESTESQLSMCPMEGLMDELSVDNTLIDPKNKRLKAEWIQFNMKRGERWATVGSIWVESSDNT